MPAVIAKRLVSSAFLLLASSFVVFALVAIAPGSPEDVILGGRKVDEATVQAIRDKYRLDEPFLVQYGYWLGNVLRGDMGDSIAYRDTVASVIRPRVRPTLELGLYAAGIVLCIGLTLGIIAAVKRGKRSDTAASLSMLIASSISPYVSGILLIYVFAVRLGWFPVFGLGEQGTDRIYHLTLPAIALALGLTALLGRVTRASLSHALEEEYVETARCRGFRESRVVFKHAFRSAFIPVLTVTGVITGYLISGAVLVEYTFGLNGLGALLIDAVLSRDFAVVQAIVVIFTATFLIINLVVDLLYVVVDPRTRLRGSGR
jgi:peptide/nickel transport system permease protein